MTREPKIDRSEQRLRELGYKQELKRELTSFTNFSVSFSVVSILTGLTSLYGSALKSGGPVVIIWGWVFVSIMSMCVAASMAEICSSYPTSGGLYFWSSKLAGKHGPFYAWVTGWWNLLGQFGCTAGIDFGLAILLCSVITFKTGFVFERWHVVLIYFSLLIIHGMINTFLIKFMAIMNTISVWVHIGGVVIILVTLLVKTESKASASFVFTEFVNKTGWSSSVYVVLLGLLQSQFTMTGEHDASALMTEETKNADVAGPIGILMAVGVSFVAGLGYLLALTFGIQDLDRVLTTTMGNPITQIFVDSVGETGAILLLVILLVAQFFCGNASVTANSRMIYAFSRDNAMPGSQYFHQIHPTLKSPIWGIWLSCFVSALLGLMYLADEAAFSAITSIATIGLYISYGLPTFCRLVYCENFEPGPISLGRFSIPIGVVSCVWIVIITVLFVLPTSSPVNAKNMNYTVVVVAASAIYIFGNWYFNARHWFKGPISNIDIEY
ncbi:hypothetical protein BGZ65_001874 [Modicella reniformis]|uniref:Amino acid transporter n=1 Tax=Modicella reniformis TaxID=1440133 RepID=A0A9P6M9W6_9FUNG|nr:hypothetical protein BGZ65_001874 [Modicella reniformis]